MFKGSSKRVQKVAFRGQNYTRGALASAPFNPNLLHISITMQNFGLCVVTTRLNSVITSYNFKKQTQFNSQNALASSEFIMNLFYLKGF